MARSVASGHYRIVMAVESASRQDTWYRICADPAGALSCDCPAWTFNQREARPVGASARACKHSELAQRLLYPTAAMGQIEAVTGWTGHATVAEEHPLITAIRDTALGRPLRGTWSLEERGASIQGEPYNVILVKLVTVDGRTASGCVAMARRHRPEPERVRDAVAAWAGWAIAASVARQAGFADVGAPPQHYRVRQEAPRPRVRPQDARNTPRPAIRTPVQPEGRRMGMADVMRVGEHQDLGDGLTPQIRAEATLRMFLGELYTQLERTGYLDVQSTHYTDVQRVYRMRRDPSKRRERRLRIFEKIGQRLQYCKDFCLVRAQQVPEADWFLTVFLGLISDEAGTIKVVSGAKERGDYAHARGGNVFPLNSDYMGPETETVIPVWQTARLS